MDNSVALEEIGSHTVHLPARIGTRAPVRFILDTGIGLNLISSRLAAEIGLKPSGEVYTGKRMSGQDVTVELAQLPPLTVGSCRREEVTVGLFDMDLPPEMASIQGFLSPDFFGETPFTIRRQVGRLDMETAESMADRLRRGVTVPIRVDRTGPSVTLFADLRLPNGAEVAAEVDTGSDSLILDARYMAQLGLQEGSPGVDKREGTDETGHHFTRYSARLRGSLSLRDAPGIAQVDPPVVFQEIIYQGLLGDGFLRAFDVTYDLAGSRLVFTTPEVSCAKKATST
jgi:Aspartyl protease